MTAVEWLFQELERMENMFDKNSYEYQTVITQTLEEAKEMEEKNLLEMLHKFGFDYTYNYKGEKTIYEWIPEWFEEYKRVEQFKKEKGL